MRMKKIIFLFGLITFPLLLTGCTHEASIEKTTGKVEERAKKASEQAVNAVIDSAKQNVTEQAKNAVNSAKESVNKAVDEVKGATVNALSSQEGNKNSDRK